MGSVKTKNRPATSKKGVGWTGFHAGPAGPNYYYIMKCSFSISTAYNLHHGLVVCTYIVTRYIFRIRETF